MDDEFLQRLRKSPPPEFAARLKTRLDRAAAPRGLPPGSRFVRGLVAVILVGAAAAFAAVTVSMHNLFTPPDDPARTPYAAVVQQATDGSRRAASEAGTVPPGRPTRSKAGGGTSSAGSAKASAPPPSGAGAAESTSQAGAAAAIVLDRAADRTALSDGALHDHVVVSASPAAQPYALEVVRSFARRGGLPQPEVELERTPDDLRRLCDYTRLAPPHLLVRLGGMSPAELNACPAHRIGDLAEIAVGYAGVVFARSNAYGAFALSPRDLFVALAAELPDGDDPERLIENPHRLWSDVDSALPYDPIEVVGPALDSRLGRTFVALALEAGCNSFAEIAALKATDPPRYERICRSIRDDGAYAEMREGFDFMQRIETYPAVLGVFSYAFFAANVEKLDAAPVAGVEPTLEAFEAGTYAGSRPLYLYLRRRYVRMVPGLSELVELYTATLPGLTLVPLGEADREEARAELLELSSSTR